MQRSLEPVGHMRPNQLRRREFIPLLGGAVLAWPLAARAQQPERMPRIDVLMAYAESDPEGQALVAAFREGLQNLGWTESRKIRIGTRWAAADVELMQQFAKEIVELRPDLILTQNTPTTAATLQQTRNIPIIFATGSDPVGSGFVASFARPGGNVTGFIDMEASLAGKWLGLLKEIAPRVARVAFLFNPATAPFAEYYLNPFKAAALSFAVEAIAAPVLSYGIDLPDNYRRAAIYADRILKGAKPNELPVQAPVNRILKGAKPNELPVQAPVKLILVINLKTAKELQLEVPLSLLIRADELID